MTFEAFCDSAKLLTVVQASKALNIPPDWFEDDKAVIQYEGKCYITVQNDGQFYLHIGRTEWVDHDLEKLEAILYQEWFVPEVMGEEV